MNCQIKMATQFVCATMNKPGERVGCYTPLGKKQPKANEKWTNSTH
jgi:hypothetical protein